MFRSVTGTGTARRPPVPLWLVGAPSVAANVRWLISRDSGATKIRFLYCGTQSKRRHLLWSLQRTRAALVTETVGSLILRCMISATAFDVADGCSQLWPCHSHTCIDKSPDYYCRIERCPQLLRSRPSPMLLYCTCPSPGHVSTINGLKPFWHHRPAEGEA